MTTYLTQTCPVCSAPTRLTGAGKIRKHTRRVPGPDGYGPREATCPGSGKATT